jgi:hypothetical protein
MAGIGGPGALWPVGLAIATLIYYGAVRLLIGKYDRDVRARFLEHSEYIPSLKMKISFESLKTWLAGNAMRRRAYALPVIFPLDVIFLVLLGCTLAALSSSSARLSIAHGVAPWWWWAIPGAYMATDMCEDLLIFLFCTSPGRLNENSFSMLRFFTKAKMVAIDTSVAQAVILIVVGPVFWAIDTFCIFCGFA